MGRTTTDMFLDQARQEGFRLACESLELRSLAEYFGTALARRGGLSSDEIKALRELQQRLISIDHALADAHEFGGFFDRKLNS